MSTTVIFKPDTTAKEISRLIFSFKNSMPNEDFVYCIRNKSDYFGHHTLEMEIVNKKIDRGLLFSDIIEMVIE